MRVIGQTWCGRWDRWSARRPAAKRRTESSPPRVSRSGPKDTLERRRWNIISEMMIHPRCVFIFNGTCLFFFGMWWLSQHSLLSYMAMAYKAKPEIIMFHTVLLHGLRRRMLKDTKNIAVTLYFLGSTMPFWNTFMGRCHYNWIKEYLVYINLCLFLIGPRCKQYLGARAVR